MQVIDAAYLQNYIDRCWQGLLQKQSEQQVVERLLTTNEEPAIRAFALQKASILHLCPEDILDLLAQFVKDSSVEVRKALVRALMACYHVDPVKSHELLDKLSTDREREIRLTLIDHIDQLMQYDWSAGFDYLVRFSDNIDRFVRRAVIRKLYCLINDRRENCWEQIFQLLLRSIHDQKSAWIRQEAARALAHYLDHQPLGLLQAMYRFISKDVDQEILRHMAHNEVLVFC